MISFESVLTTFEASNVFLVNWVSFENGLEHKNNPSKPSLAKHVHSKRSL